MTTFGLIGRKLSHSFSKKYFSEKFKELQLVDYTYELWELETLDNIREFVLSKKNVKGFNITVPYKQDILKYLDVLSEDVSKIGACNCVLIKDNTWIGYNTDWWGFLKMIENKLENHHRGALILGTGGAAKAVSYALEQLHLPYLYVTRRIPPLHRNIITYEQLDAQHFHAFPIIINTTPLGMYPDTDAMPPIPINFIDKKHFVIDLIYNPEKTLLLKESEKRGAKILNGLEMLYLQAEKSWYIWQELNQ